MAETRVFKLLNAVTVEMLGEAIEVFLREKKGMITQAGRTESGYLVQGKQEADGWKTLSGTNNAISVQMFQAGDILNVTAGFGKWSDKVGAGVLGYFVFAPLAITATIGALIQKKLPSELFDFIEKFILSGGQSVSIAPSGGRMLGNNDVVCGKCKTINPKGQKFCHNCGSRLVKQCSVCGTDLEAHVKFCPECGNNVASQNICSACGTEYNEGQKFCFECGRSVPN